tara:strand:- start:794 stop:1378 length:585 start_codon:yes stop_codon:yes gene_type:complete
MPDYEIIAEGSVDGSAPGLITLDSIPGTYKHLELVINGASTRDNTSYHDYFTMYFNNSTTANTYMRSVNYQADASTTISGVTTQGYGPSGGQNQMGYWYLPTRWSGQSTQLMSYTRFYIPNYSDTTLTKAVLGWNMLAGAYNWPGTGGSNSGVGVQSGVWGWNDTSAVTRIDLKSYETGFGFAVNTSYILAGVA